MAKRRKKKSSASTGGFLFGGLLVCVLIITAIAIVKNADNAPDPVPEGEGIVQGTQTATLTEPTTSETSSDTTDKPSVTTSDTTNSTTDTKSEMSTNSEPATDKTDTSDTKTETSTTTSREEYVSANDTASFAKDQWYMLLANPDNALPENYTFEQAKVKSAGRDWIVDARCAEDLKAMIAAAKADGVSLIICSAYRTIEKQTTNFNNKMKEYLNKGYSEEEARAVTATIIAVPGTSEHHTGMAVDIVTPSYQNLNAGFDKTAAYKWLEANCAEFGFVLRYRKDKTEITKIIYEPWHYRYVGKEAATIMMNEKISFEEFLEKYGT